MYVKTKRKANVYILYIKKQRFEYIVVKMRKESTKHTARFSTPKKS